MGGENLMASEWDRGGEMEDEHLAAVRQSPSGGFTWIRKISAGAGKVLGFRIYFQGRAR